ncbi:MAG: hypothetical protein LBB74_07275 [Chitinispirillales bacterium]|jgi:hypothetical protein|nr:hypothetical protein [Chitinispirillales bacterium]
MEQSVLFNELVAILTQENDIHQNLIDAATDIHSCARGDDINGLKRNCSIFDNHISGLEKAEERRLDVCGRLRGNLGDKAPSGRLLSIIEHSEPPVRDKLKSLRAALMQRVEKLKALNTSNIVLFKETLGGIGASMDMIKMSMAPKIGYRYKGDVKPCANNVSIFNEVI